jgi:16S rRNA (cytosine1402-N4)-methyltransferase
VISFHSLEDRIVKTFIARHSREEVDRRVPFAEPRPLMLHAVARIKPSDEEVSANPRSRSAVLRVAERSDVPYSDQLMAASQPASARKAALKPKPAKPPQHGKPAGKTSGKPRGGRA